MLHIRLVASTEDNREIVSFPSVGQMLDFHTARPLDIKSIGYGVYVDNPDGTQKHLFDSPTLKLALDVIGEDEFKFFY